MSIARDATAVASTSAPVRTISQEAHEGWEFFLHALTAVGYSAVVIDRLGFVLGTNVFLDSAFLEGICIKNKRLWIADPQARRCIDALIQRLVVGSEAAGLPRVERIVVRHNGSQPVIISLFPVPLAARHPLFGVLAALTFVSVEPKPRPAAALLSNAFDLTPAEAHLAAVLANGTSIDEAAGELSISRETARHQLKAVFLKTETHRQSQLVALIAGL